MKLTNFAINNEQPPREVSVADREIMKKINEEFDLRYDLDELDEDILSFRVRIYEDNTFVISREKQNSSVDVYEGIDEIGYFEELADSLK